MSARLDVDLDVFAENLTTIRARVAPADLMLVVKDDAYGLGLAPLVRRALREGVSWFGAFDVRTAAAVRAIAGDDVRIFAWLAGSLPEVLEAADLGVDLGIGDGEILEDVARAAPGRLRVHLKIDTGLHRNGVRPEEWDAFVTRAAELEKTGAIEVVGIWSHIAEASDDEDDRARAVFDAAIARAHALGLRPRLRHLAASAASSARPEFRYDLVRVGAFAYGIRPAGGPADDDLGIRPVGSLSAGVVEVDREGAWIDTGFLAGLPASLAGRLDVLTSRGLRRLVRIDAFRSAVDDPDATVGERIVLLGPHPARSATDAAELLDTIGEEIAVRIAPHVPRRYEN